MESCSAKLPIAARPLLFGATADALGGLFKVLANSTRVTLLHALVREGELCVSALARTSGMKSQAVSNQLRRLVDRGILAQRRDGTFIYYRLADPCIEVLLERGLCLHEESQARLSGSNALGAKPLRGERRLRLRA